VLTESLNTALDDVREGLNADGYDLVVEGLDAGSLKVRIAARENACEECLVPKDLMARMLLAAVSDAAPDVQRVEVAYPTD